MFKAQQIYPCSITPNPWIESLVSRSKSTAGRCPVCGKLTLFKGFTDNLRESGFCKHCNSTNRQRQMASLCLIALKEMTDIQFSSLEQFKQQANHHPSLQPFKIFNTETTGSVHNYLKDFEGYSCSEYLGDEYKSGEVIQGILHQNLKATSFENDSIDLLMSSDVFEHIPEPYEAFKEVYRILKPGGRHIFTVPFYSDRYRDEIRATLNEDGTVNHLLEPAYHGDPIREEGILVYVIFALEMLCKLSDIGFQAKLYNLYNSFQGIIGSGTIAFETIKKN
ncbi:MAG: methyltransferase domain-containing protein [Microcystaceae cyanobacterium]